MAQKFSFWVRPLLWMQQRHFGEILHPAKRWGQKPVLFWLIALLFGYLDRKRSPLSPELRALICVRVSQWNHCAFCIDANGLRLAERTQSMDKILALSDWKNSECFTDEERLILTYIDAMSQQDAQVTDELRQTLRAHFSEKDLIELTALISFQHLSAKFNTALDVPEQGFCPSDISQALNKRPKGNVHEES